MAEGLVVGGEHTLLGYLHQMGMDNGADYDDGVNGYFSWTVEPPSGLEFLDKLTITWCPWTYREADDQYVEGEPVEQKWRLVPVEVGV